MTDAPAAPAYALLSAMAFDRLPRARLDELLAEVQARPPCEGYQLAIDGQHRPTNAQMGRLLRHANVEYWDHQAALAARAAQLVRAPDAPTRAADAGKAKPARPAPTRAADAGKAKPARPAPTRTQGGPISITRGAESLAIFAAIPACPVWGADPCSCALCTPTEVPHV